MDFENAKYEAVELLKRLIEIPSYSREETAVADFLQNEIEALGYVACRNANNVYVKGPAFDLGKPTILLNAHLDTVKPAKSWTKDPHKATVEGDKLYGLGSNDDGASVVSLLQAFFMLTLKNQPYNLIFAATAEEEVSGKNGVESLLADLPKIDLAVVGEPTGMQMAVAEKGLMVLDCTAHGVSGHAARNEGDNAIYKAVKDIKKILGERVVGQEEAIEKIEKEPKLGLKVYNLGTGNGYSVLQIVKAFEKASKKPVPYKICPRRPGDIAECWADPSLAATELGWKAERGIEEMCQDAWRWQKKNPYGFNKPKKA